jgi:arylsulfatase A-like enzyme
MPMTASPRVSTRSAPTNSAAVKSRNRIAPTVTATFAAAALAFIKKSSAEKKPFFVNLWPDDVHSPFFPRAALRGDGAKRTLSHAELATMDAQLGVLFDAVRADPALRDNTLILICSDNGPEPGAGSAGAFRGTKGLLYEGGIRSPLVVWGPGFTDPKKVGTANRTSHFSTIDLAPTLLEIAGVRAPATTVFDGVPLRATLLGSSDASRGRPLFFRRRASIPGVPKAPDLAVREVALHLRRLLARTLRSRGRCL